MTPNQGLTVVVGFPTGVVPAPRPVLAERWSLARAFSVTPATLGMAGGVLVVVLVVLGWLLGVSGRDRRPADPLGLPAGAMVEAVPPQGIRPAQAGLLVEEVVSPVAIPATLVDLAVRGYLRIEEDPANDDWERPDYRLVKRKAADKALLGYERVLLEGLFGAHGHTEAVWLSELAPAFYHRSKLVRSRLYQDAVQRGWFTDQPDQVQRRWGKRGRVVSVAGAALTVLAAAATHYGLVALPILLAGPALMLGARWMPRRTPVGVGLLCRVNGFRAYLQTAGADRPDPAQAADQFSPYLPYAIVFGLTEQWTRTLALVGAPPSHPGTRAADPTHRTGSAPASSSSRRPLRQPSPQPRQRSRAKAALDQAAPQAAAASQAAAAEAAAAPGKPTSRARPMHCRRRAEHRRPGRRQAL